MASPRSLISKREKTIYSVIRCVEGAWRRGELVDLVVAIDTHRFDCHSFILGACSGYFKSLFIKGYATKRKFVTLSDISVEIFESILTAIYSGSDIVNKDNHIDVWIAAQKLDIGFLVRECERFAMCNLNLQSYPNIYLTANKFQTSNVLNIARSFIAKNFVHLKDNDLLYQLSGEELLSILRNPNLVVKTEDYVMEAVLKWVSVSSAAASHVKTETILDNISGQCLNSTSESNNNESKTDDVVQLKDKEVKESYKETVVHQEEKLNVCSISESDDAHAGRQLAPNVEAACEITVVSDNSHMKSTSEYLILLLLATRTCLLSTHCLNLAYMNIHVASNLLAREIIFRAALYQTGYKDHGQWPAAAVHRLYSPYENVGIFLRSDGLLEAFSFILNEWSINSMYHQIEVVEGQLVAYNQELYVAGLDNIKDANISLFSLKGLQWVKLCEFPQRSILGFQVEKDNPFEPPYYPHIEEHSILNHGQRRSKVNTTGSAKSPAATVQSSAIQPITSSVTISSPNSLEAPKSLPPLLNFDQPMDSTNTLKPQESSFSSPSSTVDPSTLKSQSNEDNQPAVSTDGWTFPVKRISTPSPFKFTSPPLSTLTAFSTSPNTVKVKVSPGKKDFKIKPELLSKTKKVGRSKPAAVQTGEWVPGSFQVIANGKFIYYINSATRLMFKVNPCFPEEILELKYCLDKEKIDYVSSFDEFLLLFCSDDDVNKTVIYVYNTNTEEARRLTILDGPASGLVTFQGDDNKYMLQGNGALWTITRRDNSIDFSFLIKLWDFEYYLNGGVFYNGELFLHGDDPVKFKETEPKYPEIFARIHIYGQSEKCSKFLPFVVLKKGWVLKKV